MEEKDNIKARLVNLRQFQILDTEPEDEFDDITYMASQICNTPISLISLLDEDRQWFKSKVGLDICQTPIADSLCNHAVDDKNGERGNGIGLATVKKIIQKLGGDISIDPDYEKGTRFNFTLQK